MIASVLANEIGVGPKEWRKAAKCVPDQAVEKGYEVKGQVSE
jgi:hypothetical protein